MLTIPNVLCCTASKSYNKKIMLIMFSKRHKLWEDILTDDLLEDIEDTDDIDVTAGMPPALPGELTPDERYFTLFATAIRKCLAYKPKFGKGRGPGLEVQEFRVLYAADPFYHWIGLDSPLMYAAHKAAGWWPLDQPRAFRRHRHPRLADAVPQRAGPRGALELSRGSLVLERSQPGALVGRAL